MRKKTGNKYGARRTRSVITGHVYHSDDERRYAEHLYAREIGGEIIQLDEQVRVKLLGGAVTMIVDFRYVEDGRTVYNEFKGFATSKWILQRKVWEQVGPGLYRITRRVPSDKFNQWRHDEITPRPNRELLDQMRPWLEAEDPDDYQPERI